MAGKRQRSNGTWEFKFTRKGVLLSPVYFTFDTEAEGDAYAARVEPLLERGVVPTEMTGTTLRTMGDLLDLYAGLTTLAPSEVEQLKAVRNALGSTKMELLTYSWAEAWVERMKAGGKAPSTLKKYVGVLARAVDWAMRTEKVTLMTNPLRLLPRGYGTKGVDKEKLWAGERDRRLEPSEEGAIRKTLIKKEEGLLFDMALETAMRMREMFTLTVGQIDLEQRTIFLDKTKNGSKRQVPISSVLF
jgi:integrase